MKEYYKKEIIKLLEEEVPEIKLEFIYKFLLEAVRRASR